MFDCVVVKSVQGVKVAGFVYKFRAVDLWTPHESLPLILLTPHGDLSNFDIALTLHLVAGGLIRCNT